MRRHLPFVGHYFTSFYQKAIKKIDELYPDTMGEFKLVEDGAFMWAQSKKDPRVAVILLDNKHLESVRVRQVFEIFFPLRAQDSEYASGLRGVEFVYFIHGEDFAGSRVNVSDVETEIVESLNRVHFALPYKVVHCGAYLLSSLTTGLPNGFKACDRQPDSGELHALLLDKIFEKLESGYKHSSNFGEFGVSEKTYQTSGFAGASQSHSVRLGNTWIANINMYDWEGRCQPLQITDDGLSSIRVHLFPDEESAQKSKAFLAGLKRPISLDRIQPMDLFSVVYKNAQGRFFLMCSRARGLSGSSSKSEFKSIDELVNKLASEAVTCIHETKIEQKKVDPFPRSGHNDGASRGGHEAPVGAISPSSATPVLPLHTVAEIEEIERQIKAACGVADAVESRGDFSHLDPKYLAGAKALQGSEPRRGGGALDFSLEEKPKIEFVPNDTMALRVYNSLIQKIDAANMCRRKYSFFGTRLNRVQLDGFSTQKNTDDPFWVVYAPDCMCVHVGDFEPRQHFTTERIFDHCMKSHSPTSIVGALVVNLSDLGAWDEFNEQVSFFDKKASLLSSQHAKIRDMREVSDEARDDRLEIGSAFTLYVVNDVADRAAAYVGVFEKLQEIFEGRLELLEGSEDECAQRIFDEHKDRFAV